MQKVVPTRKLVALDEKNPHLRNTRDGTMIKLDVNNEVCTVDMWICLDETGPVSSWQGQWTDRFSDKPVRLAALCRGEEAEISQCDDV